MILALILSTAVTLDATNKSLLLTTTSVAATDFVVSYVDSTTTTFSPGTSEGQVTTATTTTIAGAPAASTVRGVSLVRLTNRGSILQRTRLILDVAGTQRFLTPSVSLNAGETLQVDDQGNIEVYTATGAVRSTSVGSEASTGLTVSFDRKTGTTSEAIGVGYAFAKDTGSPGAWAVGSPGLNGANLDCSTAAGAGVAGAPVLPNANGGWHLSSTSLVFSTPQAGQLYDVVWYNSGLAPATTTPQTFTTPVFPARDLMGATTGDGYLPWIYVTLTTNNAGAIANITASYTNTAGTSGRTATVVSFPATAVAGSWVPFALQSGDVGVQSIQSVTFGTSLVSGTVNLMVARRLATISSLVANLASLTQPAIPGVRVYNGTCFWLAYTSASTTATTAESTLWLMDR